jgi:hypothetical protein
MPKHNAKGPEGEGSQTGRKLGNCSKLTAEEKLQKIGKGMGKKRNSGGGIGKGKRLKSNNQ